jgi:hypothetical protein
MAAEAASGANRRAARPVARRAVVVTRVDIFMVAKVDEV